MDKDKKRIRIKNSHKDKIKENKRTNKNKQNIKYKRNKINWIKRLEEDDEV